jgi:hypothetical protein
MNQTSEDVQKRRDVKGRVLVTFQEYVPSLAASRRRALALACGSRLNEVILVRNHCIVFSDNSSFFDSGGGGAFLFPRKRRSSAENGANRTARKAMPTHAAKPKK